MRLGAAVAGVASAVLVLGAALVPPGDAAPRRAPRGWVVDRVRIEPLDAGGGVSVEGAGDYRGVVDVVRGGGGVAAVNEVALEDYLRGLSEVPSSWPAEALKAQAVAARTYALHEMAQRTPTPARAVGAHLCATDACQVYTGLDRERQDTNGAWAGAVAATAGTAVLYRGQPILAKYSSSNGGMTVPGGRPYLRAVPDPDDARSPLHQWRSALPLGDVARVFGVPGQIVAATRRADSVVVLAWRDAAGATGTVGVPAVDFRSRLNEAVPAPPGLPRAVPSPRFEVQLDGGAAVLVLLGRGWGHGIGLSQYGALGKALRGMRAADILAAYYAGLRPVRLPPERLPGAVRVAVALDRAALSLSSPGLFRVLDGAGRPLAVAASGRWQVLPAGRKVRVVPPTGSDGAPPLQLVGLAPAGPLVPGDAPVVRFRLGAPSLVSVAVGEAPVLAERLLPPGEHEQLLPPLAQPGGHAVVVRADAGGGRVTAVSASVDVVPERPLEGLGSVTAGRPAGREREAPPPAGLHGLAALVWLAAAVTAGRVGLSGRRALH